MAGGKSIYLEKALMDSVLGATAYTAPGTVYVALSTAVYTQAATGSSMTEVSGGSYARVAVVNNTTNWPASTGASSPGTKTNGAVFTFPTATASWGTVQSWYVCDASSAGNVLIGAPLGVTKTIASGDIASFAVGTLIWTES